MMLRLPSYPLLGKNTDLSQYRDRPFAKDNSGIGVKPDIHGPVHEPEAYLSFCHIQLAVADLALDLCPI